MRSGGRSISKLQNTKYRGCPRHRISTLVNATVSDNVVPWSIRLSLSQPFPKLNSCTGDFLLVSVFLLPWWGAMLLAGSLPLFLPRGSHCCCAAASSCFGSSEASPPYAFPPAFPAHTGTPHFLSFSNRCQCLSLQLAQLLRAGGITHLLLAPCAVLPPRKADAENRDHSPPLPQVHALKCGNFRELNCQSF